MKIKTKRFLLTASGVVVGLINGLLGAGGGIIVVPILRFVLGLNQKEAQATAIFIILPFCVVSVIIYLILGNFSVNLAIPVFIGSVLGAIMGTFLLAKLKNNVLVYIFCGVLILAGIRMIF